MEGWRNGQTDNTDSPGTLQDIDLFEYAVPKLVKGLQITTIVKANGIYDYFDDRYDLNFKQDLIGLWRFASSEE